eukprot:TRINITY_DN12306_c0_g1_i2.p1 TRINITY_DN12306_c0_g1~~TRINITY_DN12306_c0_g1_i2.p1  ORF type:complete len:234 (-),score=37.40 TRINITY_DN12306_c0_g1_i2:102-803(-)
MIRRPPRSTLSSSSAASDVYKRQVSTQSTGDASLEPMLSTKWTVAGLTSCVLVWRRDAFMILLVVGAGLAGITSKFLKFVLDQRRPSDSKGDPGMPSSHATSLFFMTWTVAQRWLRTPTDLEWLSTVGLPLSAETATCGIMGLATVLTLSRVRARYHTIEQVLAGCVLGLVLSTGWAKVITPWVSPGVEEVLSGTRVEVQVLGLGLLAVVVLIFLGPLNRLFIAKCYGPRQKS